MVPSPLEGNGSESDRSKRAQVVHRDGKFRKVVNKFDDLEGLLHPSNHFNCF